MATLPIAPSVAALLLLLLPSSCLGNPAAASLTPIRHWEPSWVASSAQGTSVAISCQFHDESEPVSSQLRAYNCVVLLMRSAAPKTVSSALQWKPTLSEDCWGELVFKESSSSSSSSSSLRIREKPMDSFVAIPVSQAARSSWTPLGTGAICAMTGLASDVDHVSRVVQQGIHTHRIIYDAATFPSPLSQLVASLSGTVRDAAKYKGGRPYGMQALLVGTYGNSNNKNSNRSPMGVYTVDPAGAWRSWGSGCTAIGRNAEDVRQMVYENLQNRPAESTLNPRSALEVAFQSLLKATSAANVNQDSDLYEAVLFWEDPAKEQCRVATVNPEDVKNCREQLWQQLQEAE